MKVSYLLLGMTVLVAMALLVGSSYAIDQRSIVAIYLFDTTFSISDTRFLNR